MEVDDQKEHPSEEDIPSDFFDDFNKDEFIQGLSVIDSWDDEDPSSRKIQAGHGSRNNIKAANNIKVKDLRELIDEREAQSGSKNEDTGTEYLQWSCEERKRSRSTSRLDAYIQPGSRRDPSKTIEAIKKDKEVKVKEYLAKHLESSDDLRPPGTELDDFFETPRSSEARVKKHAETSKEKAKPSSKGTREEKHSSPRKSPRRKHQYERRSPRRSPRRSTHRRSPMRRSPYRRSPFHRSPFRWSPQRRVSPRRNTWRYSPQRRVNKYNRFSPARQDRDRHYGSRHSRTRSRSRSIGHTSDDFLYPKELKRPTYDSSGVSDPYSGSRTQQPYVESATEYPGHLTDYSYAQNQIYSEYPVSYDYTAQSGVSTLAPVPQPVPAPNIASPLNLNSVPSMVPPPLQMNVSTGTPSQSLQNSKSTLTLFDPLAQLVAEGKLSHEDYLKLAPNKGSVHPGDSQSKAAVLKRCSEAISELDKLALPTRLLINNSVLGAEQSRLAPKFCSPLKRQVTVEFHFTKASITATAQQNKQIIDNIIAAIGLEKIIDRSKKKSQKNMKDAAVQTTKPFCDVCEIRNTTKCCGVGTFTEPEYFTSTVHTQVVEEDLISSKSVFNPTGSAANNPTMSIAHLTPAQLVSQLAARAKTLKQSPDPGQQYGRNNSPAFDVRGSQGRHYHENYSNYRY